VQRHNAGAGVYRGSSSDPQDSGSSCVPKRQLKQGIEPPVIAVEDALLVYVDSQVIEYEEAYYIP